MKFKQYENGSCDIEFSWKERIILFKKGKLHFSDENLKTAFDTIINPLDKVIQLKTYSYKYITTTPNEADSIWSSSNIFIGIRF